MLKVLLLSLREDARRCIPDVLSEGAQEEACKAAARVQ